MSMSVQVGFAAASRKYSPPFLPSLSEEYYANLCKRYCYENRFRTQHAVAMRMCYKERANPALH